MTHQRFLSQPGTLQLTVPGGTLAYDLQGTGPLVLLVPGMGELRSSYRFLAPALVDAGYRVATVDLRGHGDSSASFGSYGDVETASDITMLLRELAVPAVVVGNSMAAGAAVIVAAEHPALVEGLVLIGPFVRDPSSVGALQRLLFRVIMARPWAASVWNAYLPKLHAGRKPVDFPEYRRAVVAALRRPGYAQAFSLTTHTDHVRAGESLAAVQAPTLVVMGDKDPDFPDPQAEATWIADALGGSSVMIGDAGHYPQSQQPEQTSTAIVGFLRTLGRHA
ncbi:alpha/beta fold hydrolase [Arthrobacter sp. MDT2-16]